MRRGAMIVLAALALAGPDGARAEIVLPPGFVAEVYVTGEGFAPDTWRGVRGIPAVTTLVVDDDGVLYLARNGRRYTSGEIEDLWPIYRVGPGGARLTPPTEGRFLHGPPLPSPQVAVALDRALLLTTFDRDRRIGVLYRMRDGRPVLLAGGTPIQGGAPLLRQPEGVAVDAAGRLYVADRAQGTVLRLAPTGEVLDPSHATLTRPRLLAWHGGRLWVAADGTAEAPWQRGPGEIWLVEQERPPRLVLQGPMAAGMSIGPQGQLFVADRHAAEIFVLGSDGQRLPFLRFTDGDAPRALAFAPATPGTARAGLSGNLFVVTIRRGAWPVNEIVRVSGPFERLTVGP